MRFRKRLIELALQYVLINLSTVFLTEYFFFFRGAECKSPVYCIRGEKGALSLWQLACVLFTISNCGGRVTEGGKEVAGRTQAI